MTRDNKPGMIWDTLFAKICVTISGGIALAFVLIAYVGG